MSGTVSYKYGKMGHIAKDFKAPAPVNNMLKLAGPPPTYNQPRAQTFNMTMGDDIQNTDILAGTLPINSICAKVLNILYLNNLLIN